MITVGNKRLTTDDFSRLSNREHTVLLDSSALRDVTRCFDFIKDFAFDRVIYGINTGFGPMAQIRIDDPDRIFLQENLIRSHSNGAGSTLTVEDSRATMLARLNTLMLGYSGVHPDTAILLCNMLNHDITATIYEKGGVGASGDLVQLAHLALNMLGEGEVIYKGKKTEAATVFNNVGLSPLSIHLREGLAILNGTSAMTGIGINNVIRSLKFFNASLLFSSMINEMAESFDDPFSKELNASKTHTGQQYVAKRMRHILTGSKMIRNRAGYTFTMDHASKQFEDKVQEYYSLRCIPQILGPVYDVISTVKTTLEDEVNSVSDNPVIDFRNKGVFHGGNFHGDYISLAMDHLRIAMTKMTLLAERQLNFLMNDRLNKRLPPFLNRGTAGLNLGMQGMQFTATSTTAENQVLSTPMYIHSIPSNNDNQDIVSMGCNSALLTSRVLENLKVVLSIQAISLIQATRILGCRKQMTEATGNFFDTFSPLLPEISNDSPGYKIIQDVAEKIDCYFGIEM
ncbi:MAG: aromatic amino acid lyase [Crocinitomicaceae bacterium]|nr:aromatic amino acid lyase [Crocinitomicaceae bacterium]